MDKLTKAAFEASRRFIEEDARPLEIARFHHTFDGASAAEVRSALAAYQNADGGFGRALEPDLRCPDSSALCTAIALLTLRAIGAGGNEPLVASAIAYLLARLDRERLEWLIIPRAALESPHAPHWNHTSETELFERFGLNPAAEILGYLYDYPEQAPDELRASLAERVMGRLSERKPLEMHELLCYLHLLECRNLSEGLRDRLLAKLTKLLDAAIASDPAEWEQYSLRPLQVIGNPDSPFIAGRRELVELNLDYEISTQNADGSWTPSWSWGGAYPEEWERARREWSGLITLEKLLTLARFGRIETSR